MNSEDQTIQVNVLDILNREGFISSNLEQLANKIGYGTEKLLRILNVTEQQGKLLRIEGNLMFTQKNFDKLKNKVIKHFIINDNLSIPEFKILANTSRKYAVPLLEYFDKIKITYREGNNRKLLK